MRVVHARVELREATAWYRSRSQLVAGRFVAEFKRARALIEHGPERWPEIAPGVRRVLFDRFPYALLYAVEDGRAVVLVVKHDKRHPNYWRDDR